MPTGAQEQKDRQRRGARLQEFRQWLGLTQEELSQWLTGNPGSSKSPISSAEQGTRPIPAEALYEMFGLSQDWVLGYADDGWWGPEVRRIRTHLHSWLTSLSVEENAEYLHPGARVVASHAEISKVSPLVTERYAAAILKVDEAQWREILEDATYVVPHQWARWSEWTSLPERWIARGQLPPGDSSIPEPDPYEPVVEEAKKYGIAPDKLLSMIRIMAK